MKNTNPELKVLFIHIPKNAGVSISTALEIVATGFHETPEYYIKDYPEIWKTYYKFCVIRSPFERFVSNFYFLKKRKIIGDININDYVNNFDIPYDDKKVKGFWPQYIWVNQYDYDAILRYEYLQKDFNEFCDYANIKRIELQRLNTTKHDAWENELDNHSVRKLRELYDKDFKIYSYIKVG
jgi:hypothetical protein